TAARLLLEWTRLRTIDKSPPPSDDRLNCGALDIVLADEDHILRRHRPNEHRFLPVDQALDVLARTKPMIFRIVDRMPADLALCAARWRRARSAGPHPVEADVVVDVRQACPVMSGIVELVTPHHDVRRRRVAAKNPRIKSSRAEPEELGRYAVPADRLLAGSSGVHDRGQRVGSPGVNQAGLWRRVR